MWQSELANCQFFVRYAYRMASYVTLLSDTLLVVSMNFINLSVFEISDM